MNLLSLSLLLASLAGQDPAPAAPDLDAFVARPDPTYTWKSIESRDFPQGMKAHQLKLTSQTWQGGAWTHDLQVYEPAEVKYPDVMLLFITGGAVREGESFRNAAEGIAMANACAARVAVLPQVPNQPLWGGKVEDDLIAETFVKFLETKDPTLPLLQPMVKSAVRAMDAAQEWAKKEGRPVPSKFVVTGASKRGWTTWLTGAVDKRVIAIAPMVIPTLNMKAQNKHQLDTWGKYSEQIADYTRRGLLEDIDKPDRTALWKLIDPYTYRDRLTMPKLQINGTNDPYWTLDSLNLYRDDLKGPSYVVYLPNAVHNLKEHRDWAVNGVGALFRHAATGREMPKFTWESKIDASGAHISLGDLAPAPKSARFWSARSSTKDFRQSRWDDGGETITAPEHGKLTLDLQAPKDGASALFCDLTYEIDGLEYHLSTPITILGPNGAKP